MCSSDLKVNDGDGDGEKWTDSGNVSISKGMSDMWGLHHLGEEALENLVWLGQGYPKSEGGSDWGDE